MNFINDKNASRLIVSAVAVFLAIIWMFLGQDITHALVPDALEEKVYIFVSGIIFSLGFIGIAAFIKTILCFSEFVIEKESLPLLLYRGILEEDSEGVFFKDKKGRYQIINNIAQQVLGMEHKDVIGFMDKQLHGPAQTHKISLEDKKVLKYGETIHWETEKDTGSGKDAFLCRKSPCRNKKGKIIGITGLCKNITILKTFQNLNFELEERYRRLFDKLPYPVMVLDTITMLPLTFNNSMCAMLKYKKEEFSKLRISVHITDEDVESFRFLITDLLQSGGGEFELQLRTKEKDVVEVSGYAQEMLIEDKRYLHILLHDVTETKKSTTELIGSELKYRSIFENANDAIIIVNVKTLQIIDANEIAIKFLGYNRGDITELNLLDLDASGDHSETQEQLNNLEIYNHVLYEHEIKNRKGERFVVDINSHKVNYGDEEVYHFVIRNITKRKETEKALKESERRYRQMFESNQAIKLVINPDLHTIEDANPAAAEFYGYELNEFRGMSLSKINILSEEKLTKLIKNSKEQGMSFYSCPHRLSTGEIRFVEVRDGSMEIDSRTLLYSIIHDVTASKRAEDQLVLASKMFDCSTDAVMITDKNNCVISVNKAFADITGYQQSEMLDNEPGIIMAHRDDNLLSADVLAVIEKEGQWKGEVWHRLKNGETRPLKATINIIKDDDGEIINHVVLMSPIMTDHTDDEKLAVSHCIGLTQLPDKTLFMDRLHKAIERSQRSEKQLAVLLIDFKGFTRINEEFGYDAGDRILQSIAKRLQYNFRESDTVAHFASDDFAVLLEDLADIQQTGIVAQKIISTLAEDYLVDGELIKLDVSIGISVSPEDGVKANDLMVKASQALIEAQKKMDSNFRLTTTLLNENAHKWLKTDEGLHLALKNDEFVVCYLPQIDTKNGNKIEAMEALVRWRHERKGLLLPLQFLPNAEQSGFITAIGFKVIDKAFEQFKIWQDNKLEINKLWLNICQSQLDFDLAEYLVLKCDECGIAYNKIALDFTESKFITSSPEQNKILRDLQDQGFYICIDDFGSGVASLGCLLQCPIDAIKIDPDIVARSHSNTEAKNLLVGLVALSEKLSIEVIVEGVEDEAQVKELKELGCYHMQGYYFSQPLEVDQVASFVKENNDLYNPK
jgi:diguanylate cyclase (GGDEF)-like protein/PAS domain S-box-containing protein